MTTFGTIHGHPADKFNIVRAYVGNILVSTQNQPYTWDGQKLRIAVGLPVVYWMNVHFRPSFMAWSSNYYTLDYVIDEIFYDVNGGPAHNPFTADLTWKYTTGHNFPVLQLDLNVLLGPYSTFPLPYQPPAYWLPRPLPPI